MQKKIAIIGASVGQRELCLKARELGIFSICFAWENGAICKDLVDRFYPISIMEMDKIVEICKLEKVDGVVTNASDLPAEVAAYVSEKLGLVGNSYRVIKQIEDKALGREVTKDVEGLSRIKHYIYDNNQPRFLPCIIKPECGGGKTGVSFAKDKISFENAIKYAQNVSKAPILVEQYIEGREVSVEGISYKGNHYVVQITDKDNSGAPHFVELAHHQPSSLPLEICQRIKSVVVDVLTKIGFVNGPSHTELKITDTGDIYLIEVNPRGGGDYISNKLVSLSTDYDYVKSMIDVALNQFEVPQIRDVSYSGIYFLCKQTDYLLPFFKKEELEDWMVERSVGSYSLVESLGNSTRNGYFIYKSDHKICLK